VQRLDQDLYGAYAVVADEVAPGTWPIGDLATNDGTDGLEQASLEQLPDAGRFTAARNLLYAFEWWFFGAFALFVWVRWMRDEMGTAETQATPAAESRGEPAGATDNGQ
jgi:surfeit locus 1 family protein